AYALYTDPPLGRVGMTEAEIRRSGRPAMIATVAMERVGRAFEKGETLGFMKILVDKTSKRILGASFLGLSGDEIVHSILDLMYANAPYTVLQKAVHIHPTVSEYVPVIWLAISRTSDSRREIKGNRQCPRCHPRWKCPTWPRTGVPRASF